MRHQIALRRNLCTGLRQIRKQSCRTCRKHPEREPLHRLGCDAQVHFIRAVEQNDMNWLHVSEVKGFDNQAAKDYAIQGIPSNFLIDGQGTIVARNLRGEALYEKISELLAQ